MMAVDPRTDAAPLMAKPQSISSPTRFVPLGNGIPMKKPSGRINIIVINMRPNMGRESKALSKYSNKKISDKTHNIIPINGMDDLKFCEKRLPIPDASSKVNKMVTKV